MTAFTKYLAHIRRVALTGENVPETSFYGAVENLFNKLRRSTFRAFVHPSDAMIRLLATKGLTAIADEEDLVWRTIVAAKPPG